MQQLIHLSATPSFFETQTGVNTADCHRYAYLFAILMVVDAFPFVAFLDFLTKQLCLETWATRSLSAGDGEKKP